MTDKIQAQWDLDFDELKSAAILDGLVQAAITHPWIVLPAQDWGRCMIRVLGEAQRLTALAAAQKVIAGGIAPEDFTISSVLDIVQPTIGQKDEQWPVAEQLGTLPWMQLAEWSVVNVLRNARYAKADEKGHTRYDLEPAQMQGVAVPITLVGIAAIAALAYWGTEHSTAFAAVETERAWAMAKAYSEIKIAEAQIMAGQKPTLSDWGQARFGVAKWTTKTWWPYAAIGAGAVLIAGAAYLGREKPRANPRTKQLSMWDKRTDPRQQSLHYEKKKPKRNALTTTANPSRAEFIREAKRSGASDKQAARLWRGYLASQRSKAGRRGGKASRRRRNAPAAGTATRALPAPRGSASLPRTSTARPSPKRAAAPSPRSRTRKPSAPKRSPSPAKRAPSAVRRAAPKRRGTAKRTATKRAR
jgi:hypothetical protein